MFKLKRVRNQYFDYALIVKNSYRLKYLVCRNWYFLVIINFDKINNSFDWKDIF